MEDIFLITIDCWRHDAPERTNWSPSISLNRTDALCHHESTGGVFPTIHNSQRASEFYGNDSSATSLPKVLFENGYQTGAFVAGNPYCNHWETDFETFWNAGYNEREGLPTLPRRAGSYLKRLLTLRPEIPAKDVFKRAKKWFTLTDRPRFCWIHLMEPHEPYHPGFRAGAKEGLIRSYLSLLYFKRIRLRTDETLPEWITRHVERLYWRSVQRVHEQLESLFEWIPSDATVVLTGDHGEEFDHGVYHHARLYDEVTRVPLYTRWTLDGRDFSVPVRQLDIGPTIVDSLDIAQPTNWIGEPDYSKLRNVYATSDPDVLDKQYASKRTSGQQKTIHEYDSNGHITGCETYDLNEDPRERKPSTASCKVKHSDLEEFASEHLLGETQESGNDVSPHIENRLKELGYR